MDRFTLFRLSGAALVIATIVGVVEAGLTDSLSPGEHIGLGLAGLQAVVIAWAAHAPSQGRAAGRGATGAVLVMLSLFTAGFLQLRFSGGHAVPGGLRIADEIYRYPTIFSVAAIVIFVLALFAASVGLGAYRYADTPRDQGVRLFWLFLAMWPVVGSIEPDSFTAVYPSTWDARVIPETILSLLAAVWLAWALVGLRNRRFPEGTAALTATFVKRQESAPLDGQG